MTRIVVGIDGSERSREALRWAVGEARLRGAELAVVHIAREPALIADPVLFPPLPEAELRAAALGMIDTALEGIDVSDVPVARVAEVGTPAADLCEVAEDADLLVVGSRGYGGFKQLLLGSVSHQVATHAPCPVVIVPTR